MLPIKYIEWVSVDNTPALAVNDVHIWSIALDQQAEWISRHQYILSSDEQNRATKLYYERHRLRFFTNRIALRSILSTYTGISPVDIELIYLPQGKPDLHPDCNAHNLSFNISHSAGMMLCAVTIKRKIGIDVEKIRRVYNPPRMIKTIMSPAEQQHFQKIPDNEQQAAFFRAWTQKEAFIKAIGRGISFGASNIEVAFENLSSQIQAINDDGYNANDWMVQQFHPDNGYIGAVVVYGENLDFQYYRWLAEGRLQL